MAHPASATFTDLDAAVAYANEFVADSNAGPGIPATGFAIFENSGLYGTTYEVAFTAPVVIANRIFAAA